MDTVREILSQAAPTTFSMPVPLVLPSLAHREPVSNWAEEVEKVKEAEENIQQSGAVAGVSALRPDAPSFRGKTYLSPSNNE